MIVKVICNKTFSVFRKVELLPNKVLNVQECDATQVEQRYKSWVNNHLTNDNDY